MPMAAEDRATLRESIKRDGIREPLRGYFDESGDFLILSGLNRLEIARELNERARKDGKPEPFAVVPVQSVETDDRQAFAIDENLARRQLSLDAKRLLAAWVLEQRPDLSNNQVAKRAGIDDKTAGKIRQVLEGRSEIPNADKLRELLKGRSEIPKVKQRTDSKGRKQAASKPKQAGNRHPEPTGKAQKGTKAQTKGQGRGENEKALRAFASGLNSSLKIVELENAQTLKAAIGTAKIWLKDLERKHKAAERAK